MPYTVVTTDAHLVIEADEHQLEGLFHVFRRTTAVMGRPRVQVVRRIRAADVLTIAGGPATRAGA